jgi:exopolyphosphatase/guanosine-5'-triphosphate,3'-diphosphate pyrophosphatase
MKIASIDIGSNTVLLLIAEVNGSEIVPIVNEYRIPRISSDLSKNGFILEESVNRLFEVLAEYKSLINLHNCDRVLVNGTQALRIASNSAEILSKIKEKFNFDLNIIPGETEALYSFKGALSSFTESGNYLMIDIGGASTEIVIGNRNEISFKKSFPIGVVVGKEKYLKSNPPQNDEILAFKNELSAIFSELKTIDFSNLQIIAVAGTPTTLAALKLGLEEYSESKIEKSFLTNTDLEYFSNKFQKLTYSEIKYHYSPIINGREDVIFSGTLILDYLLQLFNSEMLFVSGRGLRYGAILDFNKK